MAKVYTARITIQCWKAHTCHACDAVYAYELTRQVEGKSGDPDAATRAAEKAATTAIALEVDVEPCPTCGIIQPDMIGQKRARRAGWMGLGVLVLSGALLFASGTNALHAHQVTRIFVCLCVAAALLLLATQLRNPNADLAKNLADARARVSSGRIRAHEPGTSTDRVAALARPPLSIGRALCCLFLLAAPVGAAFPEIVRSLHGWPLNEEWYPGVIGPGERALVHMSQSIRSIQGYWRGRPAVTLGVADRPAEKINAVAANSNGWGTNISAKESETNSSATPLIDVNIPADAGLAGQHVTIDIDLDAEYPERDAGSRTFSNRTTHMHDTFTIQLAGELEAGASYDAAWWNGTLFAAVLTLLGAFGFFLDARGLQRRANRTRVYR